MTAVKLAGGDVVVRKGDLLTTEVDGELIAMSIENGACYGLNAVGTRIWALIEAPRSIDSLCATLLEEFDVTPETCRDQVTELLASLQAEGLVEIGAA